MVLLTELVAYTDRLLAVGDFHDYCPNGLQVEGRAEVGKIVSGVTASLELITAAIAAQADVLLVHHGYFWKGEDARITGMKQRRLHQLLTNELSLLAYHLPLDAHEELGNNVQLGHRLGLAITGRFGDGRGPELACQGRLPQASHIAQQLGRAPMHIAAKSAQIESIGWCTGAAQSYIEAAAQRGLDAYISGEISEPTVHTAREYGIHYFAAGHHATERYGAKALGEHLAAQFDLVHQFIDIDNPV
jgi:dinuclear metal center YbgI/SA1388 family protein